jgi:hypothetical protein
VTLDSRKLELVEDLVRACDAGNSLKRAEATVMVRKKLESVLLCHGDHDCWWRVLLLIAYDMTTLMLRKYKFITAAAYSQPSAAEM